MLKKILIFCFIIILYNKSFSDVNTDKIINYLRSFNTLKSNFIQVNTNGDILTGSQGYDGGGGGGDGGGLGGGGIGGTAF